MGYRQMWHKSHIRRCLLHSQTHFFGLILFSISCPTTYYLSHTQGLGFIGSTHLFSTAQKITEFGDQSHQHSYAFSSSLARLFHGGLPGPGLRPRFDYASVYILPFLIFLHQLRFCFYPFFMATIDMNTKQHFLRYSYVCFG